MYQASQDITSFLSLFFCYFSQYFVSDNTINPNSVPSDQTHAENDFREVSQLPKSPYNHCHLPGLWINQSSISVYMAALPLRCTETFTTMQSNMSDYDDEYGLNQIVKRIGDIASDLYGPQFWDDNFQFSFSVVVSCKSNKQLGYF